MSDAREQNGPLPEAAAAERRGRGRRFDSLACGLILLLCTVAYGATLNHEFVFDDEPRIERNPTIQIDALTPEQLAGVLRGSGNRPVAYLSFALNHWAGGLERPGFRLVNVLIHAANGLLVYAIGVILVGLHASGIRDPDAIHAARSDARPAALAGALVFTLHPVQVQAVTYLVQRITSLAVFFCLVSFGLFLWGRLSSGRARGVAWAGSLFAFLLALGTKEISACLPAIVLLTEWFFFRNLDLGWLRRQLPWAIGGIVLAGALALVYLGGDLSLPGYARRDFTLGERLLTQPRVVLFYLSLILLPLPSRMSVHHVFETSQSIVDPISTLASIIALVALIVLAVLLTRRARLVSFFIFWLLISLVIESSILPLEMAFEHRIYLPMAGVSILCGWLFWRASSQRAVPMLIVCVVLVVALGSATLERNRAWRTRVTLWSDVVEKNPLDERALYNLGRSLVREGRVADAIPRFEQSLRLDPGYFRCHVGLGQALASRGDQEGAIRQYREALRVEPGHAEAWMARTNIGASLHHLGRMAEAEATYRETLVEHPNATETRYYLAMLLEATRRAREAQSEYETILEANPRHSNAMAALGNLHGRLGAVDESARVFEILIRTHPDDSRGHLGLAIALAARGQLAEAEAHLEEALRLSPDDARAKSVLRRVRRERIAQNPSSDRG